MPDEQKKRINAGYEIIKSLPIGSTEFVFGQNIHTPAQFVTWECKDGKDYFWGHYFSSKEKAMEDLYERAEDEARGQRQRNGHKKVYRDEEER